MRRLALFLAAAGLVTASLAQAAVEPAHVALTLKDHRFSPDAVTVPAGQRIRIEVTNLDGASEEFDSEDLHVEKDITPHGKVAFEVGPLQPGVYSFMGELHADTASGQLEAVAAPQE
jgi:plastocyanin